MPNVLTKALAATRSLFAIDWNNTGAGSPGGGPIDAVDQSGKRRTPRGNVRNLDDEIPDKKRRDATLTARSTVRNFETAAWAIRKHLDFVSRFGFAMRTENKSFNAEVEQFVQWWSRPINFDSTSRHGLLKSIRIAEAMRCIDGDIHFVKITNGKQTAIEADRIKTPDKKRGNEFNEARTFNGIETNAAGRSVRYALHARERGNGGLVFDKWIPARRVFSHGFYDRFDQYRGVSPILASLNRFQDVYENFDYALARSKVAQLFGLVFFRDAAENEMGTVSGSDQDGDGTDDSYSVKLGTRPMIFDLDPGEDAKFLENKTPAVEFQQFTATMVATALKSLDIPYSFYDESVGNFFGNKAAVTLYLQSARDKRDDVKELLRKMTLWRLRLAIEDGDITLPRGFTSLDDLKFEWTPAGVPWFDPRDIRGDIDALKAGLTTREEIRRERKGDSWSGDVFPVLVNEQELIENAGLNVTMENAPVQVVPVDEIETANAEV
jgi:capsid protein